MLQSFTAEGLERHASGGVVRHGQRTLRRRSVGKEVMTQRGRSRRHGTSGADAATMQGLTGGSAAREWQIQWQALAIHGSQKGKNPHLHMLILKKSALHAVVC